MKDKFLVHFDLDNDVFQGESRREAIAQALESTARKIREGATEGRVTDWNGNSVGFFSEVKG
jgi:hypothetical protein